MSSGSAPVEVVVAVEPSASFDAVVQRLGAAGLDVTRALPAVATVVGRADPAGIERLAGVDGVHAVERSTTYDVGPPESDVQ